MTLTRTVRPGRVAGLLVLALAAGCGKPAPSGPTGGPAAADPGKGTVAPVPAVPSPGTTAPAAAGSPEAFARDFLKAVTDGAVTPAQLTPQFKKLVAPPAFEADAAAGFSDLKAGGYLSGLKGAVPAPTLGPVYGGGDAAGFVVAGVGPGGPYTATLRVANAGGWKADWLLVTPAAVEGQPPAATGDAGFGTFAAAALLHALTAKNDALAAGLMSPELRAKLAPPIFDSDKPLGYSKSLLHDKFGDLRGPAAGFRVTKADASSATAELVKGGPTKPLAMKLKKGDRPWDRLVDDIEAK